MVGIMSKVGRKSKYETCVKPHLEEINKKIREGITESEIAKALGISVATLNNYKADHEELRKALSQNKGADVLQDLVNSGIKAATGYWVENETTTYGRDEDGNIVVKSVTKNKVWIPANPTLHKFYVLNYGKEQGLVNDPLEYELKKAKAEFEEEQAKLKNWEFNK